MSIARPLSVSAYAPLSRLCATNPRTAIDCIACARMPTAAWSMPVAAQNRITRSCALSFVVSFAMFYFRRPSFSFHAAVVVGFPSSHMVLYLSPATLAGLSLTVGPLPTSLRLQKSWRFQYQPSRVKGFALQSSRPLQDAPFRLRLSLSLPVPNQSSIGAKLKPARS